MKNDKKKSKRTNVIVIGIICVGIIIVLYLTGIGCVFKYVTGISCPACGITRAYVSLLKGQVIEAFRYHPLFMVAPYIFLYMIEEIRPVMLKKNEELGRNILYVIFVLLAIVYIIRIFIIKDNVVKIDIRNGLIGRIFIFIIQRL